MAKTRPCIVKIAPAEMSPGKKPSGKSFDFKDYVPTEVPAVFHRFSEKTVEEDGRYHTYAVAVVELSNGKVVEVKASDLRFTDKG